MLTHTRKGPLPYIILVIGVLSTSSGAILVKLAQVEGTRSLDVAAYRLLFSSLLLLPVIVCGYRSHLFALTKPVVKSAGLAGVFLALHFATWITSLEYTTIASSVVLVSTTPIWVGLYTALVKKEKIRFTMITGLVLAFIGGVVVSLDETCWFGPQGLTCHWANSQAKNQLIGNILALAGAFMAAGYLLVGKEVRHKVALPPYLFLVYGTGGVILWIAGIFGRNGIAIIADQAWLWLILLAVIPQLIGHSSYNWALKHFSTTYVSIVLQAEPIGASLLGVLIFQEIPSAIQVMGVLVILTGILLVSIQPVDDSSAVV